MSGPSMSKSILFVSGFSTSLRAKDLAYEFERYGRLIRCDIPALKSPTSSPYAFIEFRSEACAEDAYYDMHGRSIDGRRISVQWAKNPAGNSWRFEPGSGAPPPRGRPPQDSRRRSRSPVASSRRDAPRERSRSRSRSPVAASRREEGSERREGSAKREGSEKRERADEREIRDREEDEGRKRRGGTADGE